ncbi:MAG: DUF1841 family protein [Bacteroidota bacterium]
MSSDPMEHELQRFSRLNIFDLWTRVKLGETLEGEDKAFGDLLMQHKEYYSTWDAADKLMDKEYDTETEVNPFAHLALDAAVVNQLDNANPPQVKETYERLTLQGASHLAAIHSIAYELATEIWQAGHDRKPFNTERYARQLRRLKV